MGLLTRARVAIGFAALLGCAAGCRYRAEIPACTLRCGDNGACPSGTTCVEGFCNTNGERITCVGGGGTGGSGGTGGGGGTGPGCTAANCPNGTCREGACCTGCWNGTACLPTDMMSATACGHNGGDCTTCAASECNQAVCNAGVCGTTPAAGSCATGVCVNGACRCGASGQPCCGSGTSCTDGSSCNSGTCGACGAVNQPCCSNNSCPGGICQNGTCRACGGHDQPCCPASSSGGSASCMTGFVCNTSSICECGALNQPCCPASIGNPCDVPTNVCFNGTCRVCGGRDQVCCTGGACNTGALRCQTSFCQCFAEPGSTACSGTAICDRNSCGDLGNCRNVIGMCGYCPASCEEGGLRGPAGLSNGNCTGAVSPPCDNCDQNGTVYCTLNAPFAGCTLNPNYCFQPQ